MKIFPPQFSINGFELCCGLGVMDPGYPDKIRAGCKVLALQIDIEYKDVFKVLKRGTFEEK